MGVGFLLLDVFSVYMVIGEQWWVKQELLEIVEQGLHCLAWQSNMKAGYEVEDCKDSSAKVVDSRDTEGVAKCFKINGSTGEENTKVKERCDEEIDVFLDAEVEQGQGQRLPEEGQDAGTQRFFMFQPQERDEDEKFFIVQPLDDKETDQDRVVALMKSQDVNKEGEYSDYEDITDVFRDIEIEDLEAEKENVGGNGTDVEKFLRDNSPLISKIHYRGDHKKLQDTSKLDSCLEPYEEIII